MFRPTFSRRDCRLGSRDGSSRLCFVALERLLCPEICANSPVACPEAVSVEAIFRSGEFCRSVVFSSEVWVGIFETSAFCANSQDDRTIFSNFRFSLEETRKENFCANFFSGTEAVDRFEREILPCRDKSCYNEFRT